MRASRLLQILLLLQNRGRMTSAQLAGELEVTPRTILRDVDAMTEAGLPIIVFQGNQGGIELGFNYRIRLTGLYTDEAEALGVMLGCDNPALAALGMEQAAARARAKLIESLPDKVRAATQRATRQFRIACATSDADERVAAIAVAVRDRRIIRIKANANDAQMVHPTGMHLTQGGWRLTDQLSGQDIPLAACGAVNISAHRFDAALAS